MNSYRSIIIFTILIVMSISLAGQYHVIPQPQKIDPVEGTYAFGKKIRIYHNSNDLIFASNYLAEKIYNQLNTQVVISNSAEKYADIQLLIHSKKNQLLGNEGYELNISNKKITITANTPAGVFYGIQTLLQLLPSSQTPTTNTMGKTKIQIPCVRITDYPRFSWRGLMLDVSRHFFGKEEVKRYIDQMVQYKFNTLHLHLTDDNGWRIEIKSLPRLTEVGAWRVERYGQFGDREKPKPGEKATYGGYYSHDDIKELIKYAAERHVNIVPEIDVPGHSMAAIAAYPNLSCTADTTIKVDPGTRFAEWHDDGTFTMLVDNTLNPANEEVYVFLEKVFTEIASLFPSEYIHVGGDECYKGYWAKNEACLALMKQKNYSRVEQLQGYFVHRVQEIVEKLGKKIIGWDEITEDSLTTQASVMCWRNPEIGYESARKGYKVVMAPTSFSYLDYYQGDPLIEPPVYAGLRLSRVYSFDPCPYPELEPQILGGQGNLWTENIPYLQYAFYMAYPRAFAIAENYWTHAKQKNWDSFIQRVEKHFDRLEATGINYSKAIYDPIISTYNESNQLMLKMKSEAPDVIIHYTLDGTVPSIYSPIYTEPVAIPSGNITLRVRTFRNKRPIGNMLIIPLEKLKQWPYFTP
ncbi:MAG: family 20 glycosylhydrolase [Bacteroidales bacterium]|nr:family 20 glycosylhydrolase [Bacteroidales bacterium]